MPGFITEKNIEKMHKQFKEKSSRVNMVIKSANTNQGQSESITYDRDRPKDLECEKFDITTWLRRCYHFVPLLVLLIVPGLVIWFLNYSTLYVEPIMDPIQFFERNFSAQLQKIPPQAPDDIDIIRSACKRHLRGQTQGPTVLTLAQRPSNVQSGDRDALYDFGRALAVIMSRAFERPKGRASENVSVLNLSHVTGSSHEQKLFIDRTVHEAYEEGGLRTFVLTDVEKLSGQTALIFHTLCDDSNAPFKDAFYVLLLYPNDTCKEYVCPQTQSGNTEEPNHYLLEHRSSNHLDLTPSTPYAIENFLLHRWGPEIGEDKVAALFSRITSNVAFINV